MTSKIDVIKAWQDASWANLPSSIIEANNTYLSDDFQNTDKEGNVVMTKEGYAGMGLLLQAAFKDFKEVVSNFEEDGDGVVITFHFEGTQTGPMDLSAMGLGVLPASGKKIVWPDATARFFVEGDQIVKIQEITGGMEWFLAPLGVKLPSK